MSKHVAALKNSIFICQLFSFYRLTGSVFVSRDSSVDIATLYELDGPGIESRWGRDFRTSPEKSWGPPSFCIMRTGSLLRVKRLGPGVDQPPHLERRLKKAYSYTSATPLAFVICSRVTFTFIFTSVLFKCVFIGLDI
jgi:hypothetical protein